MKLIFVYNAEAGIAAGIVDSLHKMLSPATYACDLCAITYGAVRMDRRWKAWLDAQSFETVFHHRADFRAAFPEFVALALPAVLLEREGGIETLVAANEFGDIDSVNALTALIESRLGLT